MGLRDKELCLVDPKYCLESHFLSENLQAFEMECSNFILYPSTIQEVSIHLYTLQTPQINHCPGHCLSDPPLPCL